MEFLKTVLILTLHGMRDCFNGVLASIKFCSKTQNSRRVREEVRSSSDEPKTMSSVLIQCGVFGFLVWLPIYLFRNVLMNCIYEYFCSYLSEDDLGSITFLPAVLSWIFFFFWTFPLFIINRFLNLSWDQQVADITSEKAGIKKKDIFGVTGSWSDQVTSIGVQVLYMIQCIMIQYLPFSSIIRYVASTFLLSLLYSMYAFEYKWCLKGWSLQKRIHFIETKWPYFVGFGLPLAVATAYVESYSLMDSTCLFSVLFPFCVVGSTITFDSKLKDFRSPFRVFKFAACITDFVYYHICKWLLR
ncbi:etoposide-induced protein 2.4 homolog [Argiope bruennichi]|uniref:etoposide-induced protein 2.4 homolog n=1 Tax=Argiope bruennichi TaxID=94029 RepID=UPI0024948DC5|nr:etoposide-induced protein 2.4 homolog [Argiope bruennichi]